MDARHQPERVCRSLAAPRAVTTPGARCHFGDLTRGASRSPGGRVFVWGPDGCGNYAAAMTSNVPKKDAEQIAQAIRDSGATNREELARDVAGHLSFTKSYSEDQFVADATGPERNAQERYQEQHGVGDNPSEPQTEEAERLGESAREGRGHPGSGVA